MLQSVVSMIKNLGQSQREIKLLKEKLVYNIKKAQMTLQQFRQQKRPKNFVEEHLLNRLKDAHARLNALESMFASPSQQSISFTTKLKMSLPFNNARDKINEDIDNLRQAVEQARSYMTDPVDQRMPKKKIQAKSQSDVDNQIEEIYEMGPTIQQNHGLDAAQHFAKHHSLKLTVKILGIEKVMAAVNISDREFVKQHTQERISKQGSVQLFVMKRLLFKNSYKQLRVAYPDVDKISKLQHFKIMWLRKSAQETKQSSDIALNEVSAKKTSPSLQKHEQADQFFTVQETQEMDNGKVMLERDEKYILYRKLGGQWVRLEEKQLELINGQELAVSLNANQEPQMYFKISYEFK